jgi:hypothetical protein
VLAAIRDVAAIAETRTVVEPGVVVDAGCTDRRSERRRDPVASATSMSKDWVTN